MLTIMFTAEAPLASPAAAQAFCTGANDFPTRKTAFDFTLLVWRLVAMDPIDERLMLSAK